MKTSVQSVHLAKIPNINEIPLNQSVIANMEFVRQICSAISSIRKKHNIKARLPLQKVEIIGKELSIPTELLEIIKDEANLKEAYILNTFEGLDVQANINIDAKKVAKRVGQEFQKVLKQAKSGIFTNTNDGIAIEGHAIYEGEYDIQLKLNSEVENYISLDGKYLIILDINITQKLEMEGISRDFIRAIQNARKEEDFDISDEIILKVHFKSDVLEVQNAINSNVQYIKSQVLAREITFVNEPLKHTFGDDTTFEVSL